MNNYSPHAFVLILVFSVLVNAVGAKLWAFLVAGGYGWGHYHREADVCNLYQILRANGVPEENIIVMMTDTVAYNDNNPLPGVIQYYPDGPNVYEDVIIDYGEENVTANNFFNVLAGNNASLRGSGKVIDSDIDDTILLYISSTGWTRALWLSYGEYIYAYTLIRKIKELQQNDRFEKMFIFLEAAQGGAFFDDLPEDIGVFALATATSERPKICYENEDLHIIGHASCYSSIWTRLLQQVGIDKRGGIVNLFDYYQVTREKFQETFSSIYGDLDVGRDSIKDFFGVPNKNKNYPLPISGELSKTASSDYQHPSEMFDIRVSGRMNEHERDELHEHLLTIYEKRVDIKDKMDEIVDRLSRQLFYNASNIAEEYSDFNKGQTLHCFQSVYDEIRTRCLSDEEENLYLQKIFSDIKSLCLAGVNIESSIKCVRQVCS